MSSSSSSFFNRKGRSPYDNSNKFRANYIDTSSDDNVNEYGGFDSEDEEIRATKGCPRCSHIMDYRQDLNALWCINCNYNTNQQNLRLDQVAENLAQMIKAGELLQPLASSSSITGEEADGGDENTKKSNVGRLATITDKIPYGDHFAVDPYRATGSLDQVAPAGMTARSREEEIAAKLLGKPLSKDADAKRLEGKGYRLIAEYEHVDEQGTFQSADNTA